MNEALSALPILYSFRRCPYAMRARMAIAVSGVEAEHREILLRDKPAEMLAVSPKGTVPVLILPSGQVIDESLDVMRWALAQNDPLGWLGHIDDDLIASNDGPFKAALDRYKYPHRYDLIDGLAHRELALAHLHSLSERLSDRPYLAGPSAGFTDIALFPFVRQFAATDQDWFSQLPMPNLHRWLNALLSAPLFQQIMVKHPLWKAI
jgi:glutathione S-transferase